MTGKGIITMSQGEIRKLHIVEKAIEKGIKQKEAGAILGLSDRQIRRLVKRVREEGAEGIIHRARGKPSNNAIPKKIKSRVIKWCKEKYEGFNPTLATEKLFERDNIKLSRETLRGWFIKEGISYKRRKARPHRQWRERKHCFGEMQQVDGSHHDWFEGRGPKCVLMGYIDDATGNVFARFYLYEGTIPAMDSFERYSRKYGLPVSVYMDRHTTYKSPKKPSIEEQLANEAPLTQFGRALKELNVNVIYAWSPQAKGRIERLFRTFQDRVVKEMRLRGISSIKEANKFLEGYLPKYNERFRVMPVKEADLHRPLPRRFDLRSVLCIKTDHVLRNDFTVAHDKKMYQVLTKTRAKKVTVEERLDGKVYITYKGKKLRYKAIKQRPKKKKPEMADGTIKKYIPPMSHPWKKRSYQRMVASSRLEDYKARSVRFDKFARSDPLGGQGDTSQSVEVTQK